LTEIPLLLAAEGLMGVLKDLYQEGDPDMQRIIQQSFSKVRIQGCLAHKKQPPPLGPP
jgi:hypothetical protein